MRINSCCCCFFPLSFNKGTLCSISLKGYFASKIAWKKKSCTDLYQLKVTTLFAICTIASYFHVDFFRFLVQAQVRALESQIKRKNEQIVNSEKEVAENVKKIGELSAEVKHLQQKNTNKHTETMVRRMSSLPPQFKSKKNVEQYYNFSVELSIHI